MTDKATELMSRFGETARADFERRLARVRAEYLDDMTSVPPGGPEFDVRELATALVEMPELERYVLLHRIVPDTDGPKSLEGLEALRSFLACYMLDDGECVVVPEPDPEDPRDDVHYTTWLDCFRFDPDNAGLDEATLKAMARKRCDERERPLVVIRSRGDHDRPARASEVLAAIRHNHEMEVRREAAYAEPDDDEAPAPGGP